MRTFGNEKMKNMFRGTVNREGKKDPLHTAIYGVHQENNSLNMETGGENIYE